MSRADGGGWHDDEADLDLESGRSLPASRVRAGLCVRLVIGEMPAGSLKVGVHGGGGEIGVAAFDGLDDVAVGLDGAQVAGAAVAVGPGVLDAAGLQAVEHGGADPVAGGRGDGEVETDVGRACAKKAVPCA